MTAVEKLLAFKIALLLAGRFERLLTCEGNSSAEARMTFGWLLAQRIANKLMEGVKDSEMSSGEKWLPFVRKATHEVFSRFYPELDFVRVGGEESFVEAVAEYTNNRSMAPLWVVPGLRGQPAQKERYLKHRPEPKELDRARQELRLSA